MDYKIVTGDNPGQLQHLVNQAIREGYRPHGSMATSTYRGEPILMQPMVKTDKEEEAPSDA